MLRKKLAKQVNLQHPENIKKMEQQQQNLRAWLVASHGEIREAKPEEVEVILIDSEEDEAMEEAMLRYEHQQRTEMLDYLQKEYTKERQCTLDCLLNFEGFDGGKHGENWPETYSREDYHYAAKLEEEITHLDKKDKKEFVQEWLPTLEQVLKARVEPDSFQSPFPIDVDLKSRIEWFKTVRCAEFLRRNRKQKEDPSRIVEAFEEPRVLRTRRKTYHNYGQKAMAIEETQIFKMD